MAHLFSKHRYIATKILDRDLLENEVVHHINGTDTDNRLINLCVMDKEKHEQFHAWLDWIKRKKGTYPSFSEQKRILEKDYGGILLEKFRHQTTEQSAEDDAEFNRAIEQASELFLVRKNKISKLLFLEFEEEILISPEGKLIEIDTSRFSDPVVVLGSKLTEKQLEVYFDKLDNLNNQKLKDLSKVKLQKALFLALKEERLRIAKIKDVPAYIIFHDATLNEMAEVAPISKDLLLTINGVGPEKVRLYGDQFLNVIKAFKAKSEKESA